MTDGMGIPEERLKAIWRMVFNLSVNFLHDEEDAQEATQEILLKATCALSGFRGESSLDTWIYRIAYNHLVDRKKALARERITFELFEDDVNHFEPYQGDPDLSREEMRIYVEQIKVGCTKAMLQCLDPKDRFVFLIGSVFGFDGAQGAAVCGMSPPAYRQRLSRAQRKLRNFMSLNCGLMNPDATCRCRKRIRIALDRGRIDPDRLLHHADSPKTRDYLEDMNRLDAVAEVFRDNPFLDKTESFSEEIGRMVSALAHRAI